MENVLFLVLARNGSKQVPNKNVRKLRGKPLILHTLDQLRACPLRTHLVVSTDGDPIRSVCAGSADMVLDRPPELAMDDTPRAPVLRHALTETERLLGVRYDYIFDFLCTSPIRRQEDLARCWELVRQDGVDNIITAAPSRRNPYFNMVEIGPDSVPRLCKSPVSAIGSRQSSPPTYDMNGSVYAWKREAFLRGPELFTPKTRLHIMPEESAIDVDSELDFLMLEVLMGLLADSGSSS